MEPKEELDALLKTCEARGVKIVRKDEHWFWRALGWLVMVVTFGQNKSFNTTFTTTIGHTIGVTPSWDTFSDARKVEILTHELVHVDQFKKYTPVGMGVLYLLFFLPIGLAYFRYRFEREAYVAGFRRVLARDPSQRSTLIDHGVEQCCGANYGWAWPFRKSVRAWFEENLQ